MGVHKSWIVYFMENPNQKWMFGGYPHLRKPPYITPRTRPYLTEIDRKSTDEIMIPKSDDFFKLPYFGTPGRKPLSSHIQSCLPFGLSHVNLDSYAELFQNCNLFLFWVGEFVFSAVKIHELKI